MIKLLKKKRTVGLITILIINIFIITCFTTACHKNEVFAEEKVINNATEKTNISVLNDIDIEEKENGKSSIEKLAYLMPSEIESIKLIQTQEFFGDKIEFYACNGYLGSYKILSSDNSLVSFESKEMDESKPLQLSNDEFNDIAINYVKKIWGYDDVSITNRKSVEYELSTETACLHIVEGVMGNSNRMFCAVLNGNGELDGIISYPNDVDYTKGISPEDARQKAIDLIKKEVNFIVEDNLILISEESLTDVYYAPMYKFKYEYRSENPTIDHFDFDARVSIQIATGELGGIGITPVTSNVDAYSIEEAETMAIEHIAENTEDKEVSKYKTIEAWSSTIDGEIMYSFLFEYDSEYRYSLMITATGEFWDIAGGQ